MGLDVSSSGVEELSVGDSSTGSLLEGGEPIEELGGRPSTTSELSSSFEVCVFSTTEEWIFSEGLSLQAANKRVGDRKHSAKTSAVSDEYFFIIFLHGLNLR